METVRVSIIGRVVEIIIDRQDKLNAMTFAMAKQLSEILREIEKNDKIHVVILTGAGDKAFSSGADIGELKHRSALEQRETIEASTIIRQFTKPIIAMINGYALGGGLEIALACDIRFASIDAKMGTPEINMGWLPGGGATQILPRLIGEGKALELILTGNLIGAKEAQKIGLVDEVYKYDELKEKTMKLAKTIARKSLVAVRLAKAAIKMARNMPLDAGIQYERELLSLCFTTEDKAEGLKAFLEHRRPEFKGK